MSPTLDWKSLGFGYLPTPWRFQAEWRDGQWSAGGLVAEATITLEEGSCCLHYGQQCFEGLKAHPGPDGRALVFRAERNAERLRRSAERLLMPPVPTDLFLRGVDECVTANREVMPPHGSGASLYIRPLLIGVGDNLGLRPAPRYIFRVFCSPVGPYFKGGLTPIRLLVTPNDRVAPRGTGSFKVGGNYAPGLLLSHDAKAQGLNEVLYLDPIEHRYLEEAGSANVFGILPGVDGGPQRFVTPKADTILPSITMESLLVLAAEELGLEVQRRRIDVAEVATMQEMGCVGTAAVITPVGGVRHGETDYELPAAPGPLTKRLYELLTSIQTGAHPDRFGWTKPV